MSIIQPKYISDIRNMMKLYAPEYYRDFVCIADKCRHSCCIGWEIDVDPLSMEKYSAITHPYGQTVRDSIDTGSDTPHFITDDDDRCPHLDSHGLCRMILNLGEDSLCNICREHPRFYNDTLRGKEVGLGMSCEEAARIILSSDKYNTFIEIGDTDEEIDVEYDCIPARKQLYSILSDRNIKYSDRLAMIYRRFGVSPEILDDDAWQQLLGDLEYLDDSHRDIFSSVYSSHAHVPESIEKCLERALAYFIYRHCTGAESDSDLRISLGFSIFCERLLASLAENDPSTDITEHARVLSEELEYSPDNTEAIKLEFLF